MISTEQTSIKSVGGAERGVLVFDEGNLIALIARLDGAFYGPDHGRWFIEATFGLGNISHEETFETQEQAVAWIGGKAEAQTEAAPAN